MIAIYLAPVYIILNLYILRWAYLWMGSCHSILRTMAFRTIFAIIYAIVSTSLVSGFFIKKPRVLHRALKITGNYFLGIFLYSLMIVMAADLGRLFFKYVCKVSWIHSRIAFNVAGAVCVLLIIGLCVRGIIHAKYIKVTPYEVTMQISLKLFSSLTHISVTMPVSSMHMNLSVKSISKNLILSALPEIFLTMNMMRSAVPKDSQKSFVPSNPLMEYMHAGEIMI